MERIIKVKAWHKELQEFVQASKHVVIDKDGVVYPSDFVTLVEFTGLIDKNSKEIFEGDSVAAEYVGGRIFTGKVIFNDGSFCLLIKTRPANCHDYDVGQTPELGNFESLEVFVNVYEGLKK